MADGLSGGCERVVCLATLGACNQRSPVRPAMGVGAWSLEPEAACGGELDCVLVSKMSEGATEIQAETQTGVSR